MADVKAAATWAGLVSTLLGIVGVGVSVIWWVSLQAQQIEATGKDVAEQGQSLEILTGIHAEQAAVAKVRRDLCESGVIEDEQWCLRRGIPRQ